MESIKLNERITCAICGRIHEKIPQKGAQRVKNGTYIDGLYWNCSCQNIIFVSIEIEKENSKKGGSNEYLQIFECKK